MVRRAHPSDIIDNCIKRSTIWPQINKLYLKHNMRTEKGEREFSKWLLQLGNDELTKKENKPFQGCIEIPIQCVTNSVVCDIFNDKFNDNAFIDRVILCPTNDESLKINEKVLEGIPGELKIYLSADDVVTDDDNERAQYPIEFLNSLTPSGMPPHRLSLKVGAVVMLLRNLNINEGLCNGTRLLICSLQNNSVYVKVLTGRCASQHVLIPRVILTPSDTELPFILRRKQFPLRLSYAMTINKAQGQTFERVGIYLQRPCFSHGQLYVAFSRARRFQDVKVEIIETSEQGIDKGHTYTRNVVYKQIL